MPSLTLRYGSVKLTEKPWDAAALAAAVRSAQSVQTPQAEPQEPPAEPQTPPAASQANLARPAPQQRLLDAFLTTHPELQTIDSATSDNRNAIHIVFEDLRLGNASPNDCIALLCAVDLACLDEFTMGGQPAGVAPIHMLCSGRGHELERVQVLHQMIRLAASPSIKTKTNGATPLHRAAGSGSEALTFALLSVGGSCQC